MNSDFSDLLSAFNAHAVEYLVVGAHALSRRDLIKNKKASGRLQDLADVERLEGGAE
jgi:hypothetical protein